MRIKALLALCTIAAAPFPKSTLPPPLTVALPPATAHDATREAIKSLVRPYAQASATTLGDAAWDGTAPGLDKLLTAHAADLVLVDGATLQAGCQAQKFTRLDWAQLDRDRYLPLATSDCGAGAYLAATIPAWDRARFSAPPSWADFWDIARHPGRRGLQRSARFTLEIALLADGVSAGDVYTTLRKPDGLDRAFRKLDQLKPYILWWDQPDQPAQMLGAGKVLFTSAQSATLSQLSPTARSRIGGNFSAALVEIRSWAVPTGAPHPRAATTALVIAADPARQAAFAHATGLGPTVVAGVALLPADQAAENPAAPANLAAALPVDAAFWAENQDRLEARFRAWLAKP